MEDRAASSVYVRTIIFGAVDSLVSTVALLAGIEAGSVATHVIVLTGVVYVFVEGFSMAIGSFLSEDSAQEYAAKAAIPDAKTIRAGIVMFVSFIAVGFIPIVPYIFFPGHAGLVLSIVVSIGTLGIFGYVQAKLSALPSSWRVIRMMLLGGFAIIIGIVVGKIFGIS
jgi:VIT1/CCC1 family predicted Fe2+/Mn2+ transporter